MPGTDKSSPAHNSSFLAPPGIDNTYIAYRVEPRVIVTYKGE